MRAYSLKQETRPTALERLLGQERQAQTQLHVYVTASVAAQS